MRYIPIDDIELPSGWQERANNAIAELRAEVEAAEEAAVAAGSDAKGVAEARKRAISAGLSIPSREKIWQDLSTPLKALRNGKCWYSESRDRTADRNVDHFRPKNGVHEDTEHEGYWWLAFDFHNYRLSSQWCNQCRVERINKTTGGKSNHFPLLPGSVRARRETDNLTLEDPELLDPVDPDDWRLLTFRPDGYPTSAVAAGCPEYAKAMTSIQVYHLHCRELVDARKVLAGRVQRLVQSMEAIRPKIADPEMRKLYKAHEKELIRAIDHDTEFSAAALAYARAEVYTTKQNQHFKREWLEEVLNSHP